MPRKPRFYLPDIPAHVVQRGNDRQAVSFTDDDYAAYLDWLRQGAEQHGCVIHAYVLMTNHVHLLLTPNARDSISKTIQFVGRQYVTYVNHSYGRSGTLWEGRHKGSIVSSEEYLLACMRYIEMNPVRAGMVKTPCEYKWSSYLTNVSGCGSNMITPHNTYMSLGGDTVLRGYAYRELFRNSLEASEVHAIRTTVQTGTPLGNDRFRQQVENAIKRKIGYAQRGRPTKKGTDPF
jgi:putative transposase